VWFHPQRGGVLARERPTRKLAYRGGGDDDDWREIARVQVIANPFGIFMPVPGQRLPRGFLWGDPAKQNFVALGAHIVFGPLERVCRDCGEPFVLSARAQQQLFEVARAYVDVLPQRCHPCGRARSTLERLRATYAEALRVVEAQSTAANHLAVARAVLALVTAGGTASLDKAIGHCRRARRLGEASAEHVELQLTRLRQGR